MPPPRWSLQKGLETERFDAQESEILQIWTYHETWTCEESWTHEESWTYEGTDAETFEETYAE